MKTDDQLIQEWKEGEARQKQIWSEILARGLYLKVLGIDPDKQRDSSWRTPPTATPQQTKMFFAGVHGSPRSLYSKDESVYRNKDSRVIPSQTDMDDFC